jgi:hypothetical protein
MINFCFDKIIDVSTSTVYPNLGAKLEGEFMDIVGDFSTTYPFSDPPRLLEYFRDEDISFTIHSSNDCPPDSFYFINVNFFDHAVDWFGMMSLSTLLHAQQKKFKILFYYCEGDRPSRVRNTLHKYAKKHNIDAQQIHFISHSSIANQVKNFYYLNDDEILFKNAQNYSNSQAQWHSNRRSKKFTCLIRSHKNWRLVVAAMLNKIGIYENSYGSYNKINFSDGFDHTDDFVDISNNPLANIPARLAIDVFNKIIPFSPDELSDTERNNYEMFVGKYYTDAYWNIICETHLDLDGTSGAFITEKTWKPIRHNQPFVVIGTVGSLYHLQSLGYRTFDGIINESYDYEKTDFLRVEKALAVIHELNTKSLEELNEINFQVKDIVQHNSKLFNAPKRNRLMKLIKQLLNSE